MVLAATACTATFANTTVQHDNGDDNVLATTLQQVKQRIAGAPSGTTYGVVSTKNGNVVVNTPLGKYTIKRASDGTYSFMGMTARIVSVRNGVYTIKTSLGTWVYGAQNEAYMSRSAEKWVRDLCFNELGVCG